ncbi:hypothetical protein EMCRGX_G030232 [Ephydatia muelleri]
MMIGLLTLVVLSIGLSSPLTHALLGCSWSGSMGGPGGEAMCPSPKLKEKCPLTPSYDQVNNLWACPSYDKTSGGKYYAQCTKGTGPNPLCASDNKCCCPKDGCWTPPFFNWIIAACKGSGCGGYVNNEATQEFKDMGTNLLVNYVATYQWNSSTKEWNLLPDSSFNTDGSRPPMDVVKPNGGLNNAEEAWLKPQPGGAAAWTWGYYPAGAKGAGGPAIPYNSANHTCQYGNDNCWASGNARGEIDFLESVWTTNSGATDDYRRLYATQWNQIGRSFVGDMGSTCNADGGWFESVTSNNYFLGTKPNETNPVIFAAVVDSVGTFIYRLLAAEENHIWPGLTRKTAACTLVSRPTTRPPNPGPPCSDSYPYCALFLPNCQSKVWGGVGPPGAMNEGCKVNAQQGWCQNWWVLMDNTRQWLWPEGGRKSVVQFQPPAQAVEMP